MVFRFRTSKGNGPEPDASQVSDRRSLALVSQAITSLRQVTMFKRTLGLVAAAAVAAATLAACGSSDSGGSEGAENSVRVVVTGVAWAVDTAAFAVAEAQGYFKDEGLTVKTELAPSGTQSAQQLIAGNVDIAVATPEPVVISAEKGADLTYFMPYYGQFIYQLAALDGSGIDKVSDLKGKRIGITNANSTGKTFAITALQKAGLSESDVTFVPIGVGAQQITAIQGGQVDALALWDAQYAREKTVGIDPTVLTVGLDDLFGGGMIAHAKDLKANPGKYEKYGRAMAKALLFCALKPEAGVHLTWETHPETAPGPNQDKAKALADQTAILKARTEPLVKDPTTTSFVNMDVKQADNYIKWAVDAKLIPKSFDGKKIIDTSLSKKIGNFDVADVKKDAESSK